MIVLLKSLIQSRTVLALELKLLIVFTSVKGLMMSSVFVCLLAGQTKTTGWITMKLGRMWYGSALLSFCHLSTTPPPPPPPMSQTHTRSLSLSYLSHILIPPVSVFCDMSLMLLSSARCCRHATRMLNLPDVSVQTRGGGWHVRLQCKTMKPWRHWA